MIRLLASLLLLAATCARADLAADKLTEAGISVFTNAYRAWDSEQFDTAAKLFQSACNQPSATATNFYWLGVGEFHRALCVLGTGDGARQKAAAEALLDQAADALKQVVAREPAHAESHALLGTIYGMEIGEHWLRAIWLGPRLQKELEQATTHGTNDARVLYLLGTSQFYCARRESSRREALATLQHAEKLFDAETKTPPGPLEPRWGHDSCLTFIGNCYEKLSQPKKAAVYFRKALALHPENGMARAGLARVTEGNS